MPPLLRLILHSQRNFNYSCDLNSGQDYNEIVGTFLKNNTHINEVKPLTQALIAEPVIIQLLFMRLHSKGTLTLLNS